MPDINNMPVITGAQEKLAAKSAQVATIVKAIESAKAELPRMAEQAVHHGIVLPDRALAVNLKNWIDLDVWRYLRLITQQFDMPFLRAEAHNTWVCTSKFGINNHREWISLDVPKTKRMDSLVGSLLLIAEQRDPLPTRTTPLSYELATIESDVICADTPGMWRFGFFNVGGRDQFVDFARQCDTNPVFRVILRLLPVNNLTR